MKDEKKGKKKGKSVYVVALCGVLAVSGLVYAGNRNKVEKEQEEQNQNLVDLNEAPKREQPGHDETGTAPTNTPGQPGITSPEKIPTPLPTSTPIPTKKPDKEMVQKDDDTQAATGDEANSSEAGKSETTEKTEFAAGNEEPDSQAVLGVSAEDLRFSIEEGLVLPVAGTVLKPYSAEQLVYFETLAQFRTNPAVFIQGEAGSEITAAADGIVTAVENTDKQGVTVTMELGDDYRIVYGQLTEVVPEVGDYVACGEVFAKLAEPTKYYSMEGSHLYLQLQHGDTTADPMELITAE